LILFDDEVEYNWNHRVGWFYFHFYTNYQIIIPKPYMKKYLKYLLSVGGCVARTNYQPATNQLSNSRKIIFKELKRSPFAWFSIFRHENSFNFIHVHLHEGASFSQISMHHGWNSSNDFLNIYALKLRAPLHLISLYA
jgi:hypothetical protein